MKTNELARRYATALYDVAAEKNNVTKVAEDLRSMELSLAASVEVNEFFNSPVFSPDLKMEMLRDPLKQKGLSDEVVHLVLIAVKKGRLAHLKYIANAFDELVDQNKGVTRGTVRSAAPLSDNHKNNLKGLVGKFIKGDVVLNYEEDKSLIGGMVAEVGGWTFDDSIESHLTRLNEELKRSVH